MVVWTVYVTTENRVEKLTGGLVWSISSGRPLMTAARAVKAKRTSARGILTDFNGMGCFIHRDMDAKERPYSPALYNDS